MVKLFSHSNLVRLLFGVVLVFTTTSASPPQRIKVYLDKANAGDIVARGKVGVNRYCDISDFEFLYTPAGNGETSWV